MEIDPKDPVPLNQRGLLLKSIQEFEFSVADFTEALKLNPNDTIKVSLYLNRGSSKTAMRDFNGAYNDYMKALALDSLNIGVLNNLATISNEIGKPDQTLKYLYKILSIDSGFIGAYANLGFAHLEMGDRSIKLYPGNSYVYRVRGLIHLAMKDPSKAYKDFKEALRLGFTRMYGDDVETLVKKHCNFDNM